MAGPAEEPKATLTELGPHLRSPEVLDTLAGVSLSAMRRRAKDLATIGDDP